MWELTRLGQHQQEAADVQGGAAWCGLWNHLQRLLSLKINRSNSFHFLASVLGPLRKSLEQSRNEGGKHRPTCPRRRDGPFPLGFNASSSQVKPLPGSPRFPPGHLGEELLGSPAPENFSWRHFKDVFSTRPRKREDLKSRWVSPEIQIINQGLAHSGLPKDSC